MRAASRSSNVSFSVPDHTTGVNKASPANWAAKIGQQRFPHRHPRLHRGAARCGWSTTFSSASSSRGTSGSSANTSSPAPPSRPSRQRGHQRRFVHHAAAGDVDQDAVLARAPPAPPALTMLRDCAPPSGDDQHVRASRAAPPSGERTDRARHDRRAYRCRRSACRTPRPACAMARPTRPIPRMPSFLPAHLVRQREPLPPPIAVAHEPVPRRRFAARRRASTPAHIRHVLGQHVRRVVTRMRVPSRGSKSTASVPTPLMAMISSFGSVSTSWLTDADPAAGDDRPCLRGRGRRPRPLSRRPFRAMHGIGVVELASISGIIASSSRISGLMADSFGLARRTTRWQSAGRSGDRWRDPARDQGTGKHGNRAPVAAAKHKTSRDGQRVSGPLGQAHPDRLHHLQPRLRRPRQLQLRGGGRDGAGPRHQQRPVVAARRAVLPRLLLLPDSRRDLRRAAQRQEADVLEPDPLGRLARRSRAL